MLFDAGMNYLSAGDVLARTMLLVIGGMPEHSPRQYRWKAKHTGYRHGSWVVLRVRVCGLLLVSVVKLVAQGRG